MLDYFYGWGECNNAKNSVPFDEVVRYQDIIECFPIFNYTLSPYILDIYYGKHNKIYIAEGKSNLIFIKSNGIDYKSIYSFLLECENK